MATTQENFAWLAQTAQEKTQQADHYADAALYAALAHFCQQQAHAVTLAMGEIDGRSWNHEQW